MLKKILALSLAVLMIVCMFTGCKQDEVKDPTEPPVVDSTQPEDTTDKTETPDATEPDDPTKPTGPVEIPEPGDELEDHGDFFIMAAKFTNDFAFKDENVTIKFNDIEKDDIGIWINMDIEDSLNRSFMFAFPNGAYVNGCLVWPDIYYDAESGHHRLTITGADLGVYGIRDIRTFVANDVEVLDESTGAVCKVINLNAKTDSKTQDEPKEGEVIMSVKNVEVLQYYTEYGFSTKEPLFVIKNTSNDTYAIRMTKLVINGEGKTFDKNIAQQAAIKNTNAILPFKAMVSFGLGIDLTGVTSVVCDFDIYNIETGISVKSVQNIELKL